MLPSLGQVDSLHMFAVILNKKKYPSCPEHKSREEYGSVLFIRNRKNPAVTTSQ